MLYRLFDAACKFKTDVSVCAYTLTNGNIHGCDSKIADAEVWKTEDFFVEYNINATIAWAKLYKKSCFEVIRFPLGKLHEDEFTTYKLYYQAKQVAVISDKLYYYYTVPGSIMNSASVMGYFFRHFPSPSLPERLWRLQH